MSDIQDEITRTIDARIEPEVGAAERQRVEKRPPPAFGAWDLFHLGLKHFSCAFAARRLFYIKNPAHLERYLEGLRKAGVAE